MFPSLVQNKGILILNKSIKIFESVESLTSVSVVRSSSKYTGKSASADKSSLARKEASDWTRSPARSMSSVLRVI